MIYKRDGPHTLNALWLAVKAKVSSAGRPLPATDRATRWVYARHADDETKTDEQFVKLVYGKHSPNHVVLIVHTAQSTLARHYVRRALNRDAQMDLINHIRDNLRAPPMTTDEVQASGQLEDIHHECGISHGR